MMDSEAMFRPFAPWEGDVGDIASREGWSVVLPVPDDAQPPDEVAARAAPNGYRLAGFWKYLDSSGHLLGCVARYDHKDGAGRKQFRPWSYWEHGDGTARWRAAALFPKRPLYRLDLLAQRPQDPVLVVEGEKAADAAQLRFPGYVVTTSLGGAMAAAMADWCPLQGREATIWPDADEAGHHYAKEIVAQLEAVGAATIRLVTIPTSYPTSWDLADPVPANANDEFLQELLATAPCVGSWPPRAQIAIPLPPVEPLIPEMLPVGAPRLRVRCIAPTANSPGFCRRLRDLRAWRRRSATAFVSLPNRTMTGWSSLICGA